MEQANNVSYLLAEKVIALYVRISQC